MRRHPYSNQNARALPAAAFSCLLLSAGAAGASPTDIDLFIGANVPPNIMILLDNSGSMDRTTGGSSTCNSSNPAASDACKRIIASNAISVLVNTINPVVASVREQNARLGLMTYVDEGASVQVAISNTSSDAVITAAAALGSRSVGTPVAGSILDAGRYYAQSRQWDADGTGGGTGLPVWGTIGSQCGSCPAETVLADPIDLACRESFVIFVTDGLASDDDHNKAGFWDTIGDADGDLGIGETSPYLVENSGNVGNADVQWGDDITYAMSRYDFRPDLPDTQSVVTHMIGFAVDDPYLERMAIAGQGNYYVANDAAALGTALDAATQEIFDDFADFSAAAVPTSRTQSGSAFYNVFFEPSRDPVWKGHVEAYRLAPNGDVYGAGGGLAINATTGLLNDPHDHFWDAASGSSGLNQNTSRTVHTTLGGAKVSFTTANAGISEAVLGITGADPPFYSGSSTTAALRNEIINYVLGQDGEDENGNSNTSELRPNVLGDIFHSTPNVVARPTRRHLSEGGYTAFYNAYDDRDRVLYVGANDGMLHAFDAGVHDTGDDPDTTVVEGAAHTFYTPGSGTERFGYVPGLLLPELKKLPINYPRTFYFVDGSPTSAEVWLGDGTGNDITKSTAEWATVLITGFREGGAGYLALDVTEPGATTGDHFPYPGLLWEFTDADLGQAWSQAVITRVKLKPSTVTGDKCGPDDGEGDCREQWVMIVGGGYLQNGNPNIDGVYVGPADGGWTTQSRAIYMVALDSGNVIAKVEYDATTNPNMVYSIPSTPAVLDLDFDGFADVVYVGDLGGQMWKWDIRDIGEDGADADTLIDNWEAGVFFSTPAVDIGGGVYHYRSFFFPPAAAFDRGTLTLAFGSGEREELRYPGTIAVDDQNRFYVVKDRYPTGSLAFEDATMTPRLATEADLTDVTTTRTDGNLDNLGYYFVAEEGEKFVTDVVVFAGFVLAVTYSPNAVDVCTAASGQSYLYVFRLRDAYGFYDTSPTLTAKQTRRTLIGPGLGSSPRVTIGPDPDDDKVVIKTSKGQVILLDPPERDSGGASVIYWQQAN